MSAHLNVLEKQSIAVEIFYKEILKSRNTYFETHVENPGLFSEVVFTLKLINLWPVLFNKMHFADIYRWAWKMFRQTEKTAEKVYKRTEHAEASLWFSGRMWVSGNDRSETAKFTCWNKWVMQ